MAVKDKPAQTIRSFWPRYRRLSVVVIASSQIVVVLVALLALYLAGVIASFNAIMAITMIAILAAAIGVNTLVFAQLSVPLRNIAALITKLSGEPIADAPQRPNASANRVIGITPLMQWLYDIQTQPEAVEADNGDIESIVMSTLNDSPLGIVIFDSDQSIIFSNSHAPVRIDTNGNKSIQLLYDDTETVESWIAQSSKSSVHAEKIWRRIPNKPSGTEDRNIFDIYATFHKGRNGETVLVFLNRTLEYGVEDDALDFMAFAAHEIRGPITVIRGYLDVLSDELEGKLEGDQALLLERISVSAGQLSSYIKNILNTSRYDQRHLKLSLHEDTIAAAYSLISSDMSLRASSQNRKLAVNIPKDLPTVAIDRASIAEVLQNLIDNAIKYSYDGGSIAIIAKASADHVQVSVADSGIGIPANVMKNLFAKFYRSHRSRDMVAGTGIGLYVAKAMVESHGGSIDVKSVEGKGSIFTVTLPTYQSVAEKLKNAHNSNEALITKGEDRFIDNHSMYRG